MNAFHNSYLADEIRVGVRTQTFIATGPDCAETFRSDCHTKEYGGTGGEILLVRVEELRFLCGSALWEFGSAKEVLARVGDANRRGESISPADRSAVAGILDAWQDHVDARPLFAAFWEDVHDSADWEAAGWANVLRDHMGLVHYDPGARGPVDVVLFQYPAELIAKSASGARLLVRPTILDGPMNEAFYTGEPWSGIGTTIDLEIRDENPWQEVLHPPFRLRSTHVWGVDTVTSALPSSLAEARQHHMLKTALQATLEFAELCEEVDGDL